MNGMVRRLDRLEDELRQENPDDELQERREALIVALSRTMDPEHIAIVNAVWVGDTRGTRPPYTGPERVARAIEVLLDWTLSGQVGAFRLPFPATVAQVYLSDESAEWGPHFGKQCGDCDLLLPSGGAYWEGPTLRNPPRWFEDGCPDCGGPVDWRRDLGGHRDRPRGAR